jgi:hypothetical protein
MRPERQSASTNPLAGKIMTSIPCKSPGLSRDFIPLANETQPARESPELPNED